MIVAYWPPAEGSPLTPGRAVVVLTDDQRRWIIHALKSTPGTRADEELAVECVKALGGVL